MCVPSGPPEPPGWRCAAALPPPLALIPLALVQTPQITARNRANAYGTVACSHRREFFPTSLSRARRGINAAIAYEQSGNVGSGLVSGVTVRRKPLMRQPDVAIDDNVTTF